MISINIDGTFSILAHTSISFGSPINFMISAAGIAMAVGIAIQR
jgi:hypothetical protein